MSCCFCFCGCLVRWWRLKTNTNSRQLSHKWDAVNNRIEAAHLTDLKRKKKTSLRIKPLSVVACFLRQRVIYFLSIPQQTAAMRCSKLVVKQVAVQGSSICTVVCVFWWAGKKNTNGFKCLMDSRVNNVALCLSQERVYLLTLHGNI